MKKKVYLNEYNIPMGNTVYLPLVSGLLAARMRQDSAFMEEHEIMPFHYQRDTVQNLVDRHVDPAIVMFSVSMWNLNLCEQVTVRLKIKYPKVKIIWGGPSATPGRDWVDHVVHGDGERELERILGLNLTLPWHGENELDEFVSPYSSGEFDQIIKDNDGTQFQAIVETNRGCCYKCAYCYWGNQGGIHNTFRFHSFDYVAREAEWIGKNHIPYVFCADSNFGMFKRDTEIARIYAKVKEIYGYPEKFRVCYGKGAQDSIFQSAEILHKAGLAKAITLSKQSTNPETLKNIGRSNITRESYIKVDEKCREIGISSYTELILGLPGDTKDSFKCGVEQTLSESPKNRLFIYHCSILPNTEMDDKGYRALHGLKTQWCPITEIHCSPRPIGIPYEFEEIVIGTNTMPVIDWMECAIYAWKVQLEQVFHVKPTAEIIGYFGSIALSIVNGGARGQIVKGFGDTYWEPEEAAFLMMSGVKENGEEFARENVLFARKGK
jgi:Radical SAM superfamily